ncbi:nitrate- and nitrite sensing domain-containing protein [Nocardia gamkensis]|uniref:sensor histidine kinase n=1 Tax=Nocardia gamkensis TaxID=352869 RepID=UPI0036E8C329
MFKAFRTLRARVMAIALIPSIALLVVGGGGATYFMVQGQALQHWADEQRRHAGPALGFAQLFQQERRVTLLRLAGHRELSANLQSLRPEVDQTVQQMITAATAFEGLDRELTEDATHAYEALTKELASVRARVDADAISILDAYSFYNRFADIVSEAIVTFARSVPATEIALELHVLLDLFSAAESMARAHDLAIAAEKVGRLSAAELEQFSVQVGSYHSRIESVVGQLTDSARSQLQAVTDMPEWHRIGSVESVLIARGAPDQAEAPSPPTAGQTGSTRSDKAELPLSVAEWQAAVATLSAGMQNLSTGQAEHIAALTHDMGGERTRESLLTGVAVLAITLLASLTALRLSTRMIRRLHRLRAATVSLTDDRLPVILGALSRGEPVDVEKEMTRLDFGIDEVGQVADAFNRAQLAAVNAAVVEARTREGVNAVFLNIAHRSQVVLHRHLKLLNEAEYEHDDPKVLDLLFRMHHLATRERRNAENLIILGGEQPRRQWRKPVQLDELVRAAVAEAQDYYRVRVARLPEVKVSGAAITDLIHLLAELVDNATSFSPPDSRVEVHGNPVGRGVVVEVVDQGLGIPPAQMAQLNETLANPPDFALEALTADNRLGMFVVARLADRIDASVRLTESEYGGVKAVVLIPAALLTPEDGVEPISATAAPAGGYPSAAVPERPWRSSEDEDAYGSIDRHGISPARLGGARHEPADRYSHDARPDLPRRQRQSHLAPQLAHSGSIPDASAPPESERTAEQARDLYSAIESGTRQGRSSASDPSSFPGPRHRTDTEREGHSDEFR